MKKKAQKEPAKKPEKMNWPKSEPVTLPIEQLTTAPWNPRCDNHGLWNARIDTLCLGRDSGDATVCLVLSDGGHSVE